MTKPVTVELTDAQAAHFAERAESQSMTLEALVGEAIQRQVEYDAWIRDQAQTGIDEIERGEFHTHDDVVAIARARRQELLADKGGG